jgi:hypothetical protein
MNGFLILSILFIPSNLLAFLSSRSLFSAPSAPSAVNLFLSHLLPVGHQRH